MTTARCLYCGCPASDHIPARYALRVELLHLLPAWAVKHLKPLRK